MGGSGRITTEFTAWCSRCCVWVQTSDFRTKRAFAKRLRSEGWRLVARQWVCDKHDKEPPRGAGEE